MDESSSRERIDTAVPAGRTRRAIGFGLGLLLLIAAVVAVLRQGDAIAAARSAAGSVTLWQAAVFLTVPLFNWLLTSCIFWLLTRRFGSVGYSEMAALLAAGSLANYLPLKPGLIGRVAYQAAMNGIPASQSVVVLVQAIIASAISAVALILVVLSLRGDYVVVILLLAALAACTTTIAILAKRWEWLTEWRPIGAAGRLPCVMSLSIAIRILETLLWAARYWVAFALVDFPVNAELALCAALIAQIADLSPIPIGLREWATGLLLPAFLGVGTAGVLHTAAPGIAADLLCRSGELAVELAIGLPAGFLLNRKLRSKR